MTATRTACRATALSLALALLYAVAASPLFVFCIGASGHRQIEITLCGDCCHPDDSPPAEPVPAGAFASALPENCGDCSDFELLLPARSDDRPDRTPTERFDLLAVESAFPPDALAGLPARRAGSPSDNLAIPSPPAFPLSLRI